MTMPAKGGRWPTIDKGVSQDHRCLLLFFHLLHAVHRVPWKSCCELAPDDPDYDNEKKAIERRFNGGTNLTWKQIVCYLNKLPEPARETATMAAFCLFKRWCEGSRAGRSLASQKEARQALAEAETSMAGREWPAVAWLWVGPDLGLPVTSTPPIVMSPTVATPDGSVATVDSGRRAAAVGTLVPRADLEDVERQLAEALDRARESGDRAEAAEWELEEAARTRSALRDERVILRARCIQLEEDLAAARAGRHHVPARNVEMPDPRALEAEALLARAQERVVAAEQSIEQLRRHEADLVRRVAVLEAELVREAGSAAERSVPALGRSVVTNGGSRRRWPQLGRREELTHRPAGEDDRADFEDQAILAARPEETDRLRRSLAEAVLREFRLPAVEVRDVLITARDVLWDAGPLATRLGGAVATIDRLVRLLDSSTTAAGVAPAGGEASDLKSALDDVIAILAAAHAGRGAVVRHHVGRGISVGLEPGTLGLLLTNLVDAVRRAAPPGSTVDLIAGRVGDQVLVRFRTPIDPGGVGPDGRAAIARTEGVRHRLHQIVSAYGGRMPADAVHVDDRFEVLDVELPAAGPAPTAGSPRSSGPAVTWAVRDGVSAGGARPRRAMSGPGPS